MGPTNPSTFGVMLRRYREAAGLSQERLAERAGLSLRGISDLERGARTTPRLETVRMLADGLGLGDTERAALLAARASVPSPPRVARTGAWPALPRPATSFIGRSAEIDAIANMLGSGDARLVTLLGPGGVGKTRIALEIAHLFSRQARDGAVFIDLSPVRDAALVLPAIANRLGIPDIGGQGVLDMLEVALRDREMVMVLDNLEQVIDAATDLAALLARCPSLAILATSRIVLHVAAEHVVPIEPLALPTRETKATLSSLAEIDSVSLFVTRAHAADATFALTHDNVDVVMALVNRLEGLPLAIELAAARIRMFPPDVLLERLDRQLPLLTCGPRDAPERQRTMRDAIAWSHELLTPIDQVIFRRLSIFVGGFTLEAAESVVAGGGVTPEHVLDGVRSLVDNTLIKRRELADGTHRFLMLQTVREFGIERLMDSGEEEFVRTTAHENWIATLAAGAEFLLMKPDQVEWLERLETEHENLRSHLDWLIESERIQDALDLSGSLGFFRWIRGYYAEARQKNELLLAHPAAASRTRARGKALIALGTIVAHQGDIDFALDVFREAIELCRELDERRYLSLAWTGYGVSWIFIGQINKAEEATLASLEIAKAIDDQAQIEGNLNNLSNFAAHRGEWDRARDLLETALAIGEEIGNTWGVALESMNLGSLLLREGKLDRAEELFRSAARLVADLGDKRDMPGVYWLLAEVARQRGDLDAATQTLEQALSVARDMGDSQKIALALSGLAQLAHVAGGWDTALNLNRQALRTFAEHGDIVSAMGCLDVVADVAISTDAPEFAAWCIGAMDGVMGTYGVSRMESSPGVHQARVDATRAALGDHSYQEQWARGHATEPDAVVEEVLAWQPVNQPMAAPDEAC